CFLQGFDVAVALRALAEHDGRARRFVDVAGGEKARLDALEDNFVLVDALAELGEILNRIVAFLAGVFGVATDGFHAVPGEKLKAAIVAGTALAPELHQHWFPRGLDVARPGREGFGSRG